MPDLMKKSFNNPEEAQEIAKAKWELVSLENGNVYRYTFEPGWRWTEHAAPSAGTPTCQEFHPLMIILSGRIMVQMDGDGKKEELGPGDIGFIPPGHDAWVVGDEAVIAIDFQPVK